MHPWAIYLSKRSNSFFIAVAVLLSLLFGAADFISGPEVSFLLFYLVPLFVLAWFVGAKPGRWVSFLLTAVWFFASGNFQGVLQDPFLLAWNVLTVLVFFILLFQIVSTLHGALLREKELARTDELTGLSNRRACFELVSYELLRSKRQKNPVTVAYLDVDDFKSVNDHFGHKSGDEVLKLIAKTLRENVRASDIVARLGGDEFVIVMSQAEAASAKMAIQRIHQALTTALKKAEWFLTVSIGAVTWQNLPESADEAMRVTDRLMYSVKEEGKNQFRFQVC